MRAPAAVSGRPTIEPYRLSVVLGALLYAVLLQYSYVAFIQARWEYMGMEHHPISVLYRIAYTTIAVLPSLWMPVRLTRPSQVAYWFIYVTVLVPSTIVPHEIVGPAGFRWIGLGLLLTACMILLQLSYRLPLRRARRRNDVVASSQFWMVFWGGALVLYLAVASQFGLRLTVPSFSEVYVVRDEYAEAVRSHGALGAYAVAWCGNVVNPFLILWGLAQRRRALLVIGALGQLVLFSVTGLKSLVFSVLLIGLLALATRSNGRRFGFWVMYGSLGIVVAGMLEEVVLGTSTVNTVLVRRVVVIPGQLFGYYVDFFADNEKAWLGHSILSSFVRYPYDLPPPQLIAAKYFKVVLHANTSFWADGFANFGYAGIIGATGVVGGVFYFFDRAALGIEPRIAAMLFGLPAFNLANSSVLTCILTHGIGLAIVLVYFLPRQSPRTKKRAENGVRPDVRNPR